MIDIIVSVIGPVVAIVAVGATVGQRLRLETTTLSKLAFWILGPAFMFDSLAYADLAGDTVVALVVVSLGAMVASGIVAATVSRSMGNGFEALAADVMSGIYGNVGNTGIAICVFALGDSVRPAASVVLVTVNTVGVIVGVTLASARTASPLVSLRIAFTTPMTVAALVAIPVNALNVEPPVLVVRPIALVAGALIPIMLITLGLQLRAVGARPPTVGVVASGPAKLLVAPVVAYSLGRSMGMTGDVLGVALIQASMPPAVFTMLVAIEHRLVPERVTSALVWLTFASLLTVPVAVAIAR